MEITLKAISFNHDPSFKSTGAVCVRCDEFNPITIPEWTPEKQLPKKSPAAYAASRMADIKITIKVKLSSSDLAVPFVNLRAIDSTNRAMFDMDEDVPAGKLNTNVLGELEKTQIRLLRGEAEQIVTLDNTKILETGVSVNDIAWLWQYSTVEEPDNWKDLVITRHRIYTLVSAPTPPWKPDSFEPKDTQVPWIKVLDHACDWASGADSDTEAATLITEQVNELGAQGIILYDLVNGGDSAFTHEDPFWFDCSQFLRLLRGKPSKLGRRVNCDDCAAVVTSFANIVGCDLGEGRLGDPGFDLNPHLKIGITEPEEGDFQHHTVACKGPLATDRLFDACVQLDHDENPSSSDEEHDWFVPTNIIFGEVGDHQYRFRLAVNPSVCNLPVDLNRRQIGLSIKQQPSESDFLEKSRNNPFMGASMSGTLNAPEWRFRGFRFLPFGETSYFYQSFWRHTSEREAALSIDAYDCGSAEHARNVLASVLSGFELSHLKHWKDAGFGDVVFALPTKYAIVFSRGRFVFRFRNVGEQVVACDQFAKFVDALLLTAS